MKVRSLASALLPLPCRAQAQYKGRMASSLRRKLLWSVLGLSAVLVPTLTVPWFGARRLSGTRTSSSLPPPYVFPTGFLWGTATAAYQIENTQDDDWAVFEKDVLANHRVE